MGQNRCPTNKAQITELHTRWSKLEPEEMDDVVQECRFTRGIKTDTTKLTLALPKGPDRGIILASLRSLAGVRVLVGQAPPGYLEEELSEFIEALSKQ